MSTPTLTPEQQAAFNILNALKTQNRDVSSLTTAEKQILYTYYTEDDISCYKPLRIKKDKSCCNRDYSKKIQRADYPTIILPSEIE